MAMERYEDLQTNLFTRYPKSLLRMILFNGTSHANGSSTTAATFAAMLARDSQVRVLLVDMNLREGTRAYTGSSKFIKLQGFPIYLDMEVRSFLK